MATHHPTPSSWGSMTTGVTASPSLSPTSVVTTASLQAMAPPHKLAPALNWADLTFAVAPMLILLAINSVFRLALGTQIAVSTIRATLQLTVIGFVLVPVFEQGLVHPVVTFLYTMLMVLIAAFEATSRPKYLNKFAYICVWGAIVMVVGCVSMYMAFLIVKPDPWWDPRVIIPTCGMMLGNTVTAVGLSLNSLLTTLYEQSDSIEILLSFGATRWEACRDAVRDALRTGLMPTLNNMAVIGVVSIPGMMTGEILGGSSPEAAARYQLMIILLISICNFLVATLVLALTLFVTFDASDRLRRHVIHEQRSRKRDVVLQVWDAVLFVLKKAFCVEHWTNAAAPKWNWPSQSRSGNSVVHAPLLEQRANPTSYNTQHGSSFAVYQLECPLQDPNAATLSALTIQNGTLQVVGLSQPGTAHADGEFLFKDQSFRAAPGEIVVIMGPSGCGKTTMLRQIANLDRLHSGTCRLGGMTPADMIDGAYQWRRSVRFVNQNTVTLNGSPKDLIKRLETLALYHVSVQSAQLQILENALRLSESWGVGGHKFDRLWSGLSAGESQRIMLAIHLATRPKVLLLDEPTSALDPASKQQVEVTLRTSGVALVWVTHDQDQAARLGSQLDLSKEPASHPFQEGQLRQTGLAAPMVELAQTEEHDSKGSHVSSNRSSLGSAAEGDEAQSSTSAIDVL